MAKSWLFRSEMKRLARELLCRSHFHLSLRRSFLLPTHAHSQFFLPSFSTYSPLSRASSLIFTRNLSHGIGVCYSHRLPEPLQLEERRVNELLASGHVVEGILIFENKLRQHLDGLQVRCFRINFVLQFLSM